MTAMLKSRTLPVAPMVGSQSPVIPEREIYVIIPFELRPSMNTILLANSMLPLELLDC